MIAPAPTPLPVSGVSPVVRIARFHVGVYGLYVYASTTAILTTALKAVKFAVRCDEIPVNDGDIVRIDSDGKLSVSTFEERVSKYNYRHWFSWYGYDLEDKNDDYTNDLLMICGCYGVDRETLNCCLNLVTAVMKSKKCCLILSCLNRQWKR